MAIAEQDFKAELQTVQSQTKVLAAKRDGLIRDAGVQQQKVTEALAKLKELGVENVEKLTIAQLKSLRDTKQFELEEGVKALQAKVAEGNQLLAEYEKATV